MRIILIAAFLLTAGCCSNGQSYVDWGGVWFGCPKGQTEKPAVRWPFGMVKQSSYCEPAPPAKEQP